MLACAIAESGLNPRAERWGRETPLARIAISGGDWARLAQIISRAWPDVSFGYGQQIVRYHYAGDHTATTENCLAVRARVFAEPQENLDDMARRLAAYVRRTVGADLSQVDGDPLLGALVIYNAGSLRPPGDPWWVTWAANVASYRAALTRAGNLLGE